MQDLWYEGAVIRAFTVGSGVDPCAPENVAFMKLLICYLVTISVRNQILWSGFQLNLPAKENVE